MQKVLLDQKDLVDYIVLNRRLKYSETEIDVQALKNSAYVIFKKNNLELPADIIDLLNHSLKEYAKYTDAEIKSKLNNLDISFKKTEYVSKWTLPDNAILRYAVNPNYEPTLGNLRGICVHKKLISENKNITVILRFDDTDPNHKPSTKKGYTGYFKALKWLQLGVKDTIYASKRISEYYRLAEELLKLNIAYITNTDTPYSLELFKRIIVKKSNHILKIKYQEKDWIAFRYIFKPHTISNTSIIFWPTLNFQSFVDDYLCNVTHIFRGKDLRNTEGKQAALFKVFNKPYPICVYWGRNRLSNYKLSSSKLCKEKEVFKPSHVSLSNLIYYNVSPIALQTYFEKLELTDNDSIFNISLLKIENKKAVKELKVIIYSAEVKNYIVYYTEHITNVKMYMRVNFSFIQFKKRNKNCIFKYGKQYFKINPYSKLVKILY